MKKGGVIHREEYDAASAFHAFIGNSVIEHLGSGLSGMTCRAIWQGRPEDSPYVGFRASSGYIGTPITSIAFKIVIIHTESGSTIAYDTTYSNSIRKKLIPETTSVSEFQMETDTITDMMGITTSLEPIGPIPLIRAIFDYDNSIAALNAFSDKSTGDNEKLFIATKEVFEKASQRYNMQLSIGIHVMECMDYRTMFHSLNQGHQDKNQLISLALFELLTMAQRGWNHGDFHQSNILIAEHLEPNTYFKTERFPEIAWAATSRAFIIDFGRSFRFSEPTEITSALDRFMARPDSGSLENCSDILLESIQPFSGFQWIKGLNGYIARSVWFLFKARQAAIKDAHELFKLQLKQSSIGRMSLSPEEIDAAVEEAFPTQDYPITMDYLKSMFLSYRGGGGSSKKEKENQWIKLFLLAKKDPHRMAAFRTMFRGLTYLDTIKINVSMSKNVKRKPLFPRKTISNRKGSRHTRKSIQ
jgi:hypothetical protein